MTASIRSRFRGSPERSHTLAALLMILIAMIWALGTGLYTDAFREVFRAADFNIFHEAGRIAGEGRLADAYRIGALDPAVIVGPGGSSDEIYYTYPPQFGFVIQPLGGLPRVAAFGLFVGLSLALFLYVLARLAGDYTAAVLVTGLPVLAVSILNGQTSLLVGALAGFFCLGFLRGGAGGGVALALMAIKPHLAPGFVLLGLVTGRWRLLALAAAVTAASLALATLVFGADAWAPFFASGRAAAERFATSGFKFYRMTSVYALASAGGAAHGLALAIHLATALVAAAVVGLVALRAASVRIRLGVAALGTLAFSPYVYEYDQTIMLVGLALLWRDLAARSALVERLLLVVAAWLTTYYVFVRFFTSDGAATGAATVPQVASPAATNQALPVEAMSAVAVLVLVALILIRAPRGAVPGAEEGRS